ncbi:DUF4329 domain-containing protein [Yoonia sediminilitoris]|nr:DUF4329 domain-containing protein [Yoonia sediminilitoris]
MMRSKSKFTALFSLCLLASCGATVRDSAPNAAPASALITPARPEMIADYAKRYLNSLQPASFSQSREFCGFFVERSDGQIVGTTPQAGTSDGCSAGFVPDNAVASYHTHGGYLPQYINEIPSINDAESAVDIQLDDYVSTPGGRFWKVDGTTGTTTMLCAVGCLKQDPIFVPNPQIPPAPRYTLTQLRKLQG